MQRRDLIEDQAIGHYKKQVVKELKEYKKTVQSRFLIDTDEKRAQSYQNVIDKLDDYDLVFLQTALDEALRIDDLNSQFRDKVGKTALSQLYNYTASGIQLIALMGVIINIFRNDQLGVCRELALCYLTDQLETHLQHTLKNKKLVTGFINGFDAIARTKFSDALNHTFNSLSLNKIAESAHRVGNNVYHFAQSHFRFFRQKLSKDVEVNALQRRLR